MSISETDFKILDTLANGWNTFGNLYRNGGGDISAFAARFNRLKESGYIRARIVGVASLVYYQITDAGLKAIDKGGQK